MACYRIYVVNRDTQLANDINAECSSDQEACVFAESLLKLSAQVEVWRGTKLVRVLSLSMPSE